MGALNYNFKKLYHTDAKQRAELLATNFASMETDFIKREVQLICSLRPNLSKYVYHTSLNFSKEELHSLSNQMLTAIALDYLEENGFTNHQYFIFRHHDAEHPHLHLLVNRIGFDGSVVSDSNNYRKSEAILRKLEYQYNLISVEQSSFRAVKRNINIPVDQNNNVTTEPNNNISQRAPKKDEIEMALRTGKPSNKMALQEKLKDLLSIKSLNLTELINLGEKQGINFLFNQASTGRISGITYFYNGFKAKGQALGHQFKWAELINKIDYEQVRDSAAIGAANGRTKALYGDLSATERAGEQRNASRIDRFSTGDTENNDFERQQQATIDETGSEDQSGRERSLAANPDVNILHGITYDHSDSDFGGSINIQISDDEDDAKKRRRRKGR